MNHNILIACQLAKWREAKPEKHQIQSCSNGANPFKSSQVWLIRLKYSNGSFLTRLEGSIIASWPQGCPSKKQNNHWNQQIFIFLWKWDGLDQSLPIKIMSGKIDRREPSELVLERSLFSYSRWFGMAVPTAIIFHMLGLKSKVNEINRTNLLSLLTHP